MDAAYERHTRKLRFQFFVAPATVRARMESSAVSSAASAKPRSKHAGDGGSGLSFRSRDEVIIHGR
jgi:hypothetical protein